MQRLFIKHDTMTRKYRVYSFWVYRLVALALVPGFRGEMTAQPALQKEALLPKTAPIGFALAQPPEFYGTESAPLADGNIFHFIDGGGVVYLNHGFRAVAHILYRDEAGRGLTIDVFDMGTPANARAAWSDELICPSGFSLVQVGTEAKAYHFEPDFFLYFVKGRYLIYVHVADDSQLELLMDYAKQLFKEEP